MSFEEAKFFKEAEQDALDCAGTKKKKEKEVSCAFSLVYVFMFVLLENLRRRGKGTMEDKQQLHSKITF